MFWGVSDRFVTGAIMAHFAKQSRVRIFVERTHLCTPLDQNSCFRAFWTVSLLHESRCKTIRLVPLSRKFAKQSHVGISRNKRTRSATFDPKLMFWGVSDRFTARKPMQNWPNWCHYCKSSLNKVVSKFFAANAPDPLN
jgi:hypothetical protein